MIQQVFKSLLSLLPWLGAAGNAASVGSSHEIKPTRGVRTRMPGPRGLPGNKLARKAREGRIGLGHPR